MKTTLNDAGEEAIDTTVGRGVGVGVGRVRALAAIPRDVVHGVAPTT